MKIKLEKGRDSTDPANNHRISGAKIKVVDIRTSGLKTNVLINPYKKKGQKERSSRVLASCVGSAVG